MMAFYIQEVKGQLDWDIIMFCKNTFRAIIQCHDSGTEEEIFHIWRDAELILGGHLETVVMV